MRIIPSGELKTILHFPMLMERLRQIFRSGGVTPAETRYEVETYGTSDAALTLTPVWQVGRHIGVQVTTHYPDNAERKLPCLLGTYLLLDGKSGVPLALIDGPALVLRRAASASVLAATYLARHDSERLLVVGTGNLAPILVEAYTAVMPIREVLIWGRSHEAAQKLAGRYKRIGRVRVGATEDLEAAVGGAHIVVCATTATEPVIRGAWLAPGTHLDLIGSRCPEHREADEEALRRGRVFVDTREGALARGGDLIQALAAGVLTQDDIAADLFDLTRGERSGRRYYDQITIFKAVGTPLEDLAAAQLAYDMGVHLDRSR